jgi:Xaa-Pro dipeptidase
MAKNWQAGRLRCLFADLKGVDALLIMNTGTADPNFHYLTGFTSGLFEDSVLVATPSKLYLITSQLEYQTAMGKKTPLMHIINSGYDGKPAKRWLLKLVKGKKIGINGSFLPTNTYKRLKNRYKPKKMVDVSGDLLKARMIKGEDEIRKIRKAAKITKGSMKSIQKYFKKGVTELQIAAQFDFLQMSLGASGPSFDTIVCFGKNAALPHHSPDKTRLRKGDFVLIDAGAKVENYCSDITRTFIFGSAGNEKQKEMLETVRKAQKEAISAIRPSKNGKEIHAIAENIINNAYSGKFKGRFIHSLGHSLGLEVHDGPGFSRQSNKLKPGMVITAEPGIYITGFGGVRIEDDIVITQSGCKIL